MSEFKLKRIKDTGVYERFEVVGWPSLRVHSLHHVFNRDVITGYALINASTGNYIHVEPRLVDLRGWMKKTNLRFPPPRKKTAKKKINGVARSRKGSSNAARLRK